MPKQSRKTGQMVEINLGDQYSYARVLKEPIIAFYDGLFSSGGHSFEEIAALPIAFQLMVHNSAITSGRWKVIYDVPLPSNLDTHPAFFKQDISSGKLFIYQEIEELGPSFERPATLAECRPLEAAAVWEPSHVEDRLRDHYAGRPNKWVNQLNIIESD